MTGTRFKPYPAYKDSGIEWLGEIPADWEAKRLKSIASISLSNVDKKAEEGQEPVLLCNYVDVYKNEYITPDMDFMSATATSEQIRRFALRGGDVLITKDSESWDDIAVPAYVTEDMSDVLCGYHLALIRPSDTVFVGRYMARAISAIGLRDQFWVAANGITRYGLTGDSISTALLPVPPLDEQYAIVDFLDRETAKIDALVEKKERLIKLLKEKRTALITHAVTKGLPAAAAAQAGLDPNVPMRDSGIDWLGQIPAHWETRRLKQVSALHTGGTPTGVSDDAFQENGIPWVKPDDLLGDRGMHQPEKAVTLEASRGIGTVPQGTALVCGIGTVGKFGWAISEVCTNQQINSAEFGRDLLPRFGQFAMWGLQSEFERRANKVTIAICNKSSMGEAQLAIPPRSEQESIADFLDRETANSDVLIAKVQEAIERLKEYRTALISAAVTGKIDVRGEAISVAVQDA